MVSPNLNRILKDVEALNDADQQELRRLLNARMTPVAGRAKEERLDQLLQSRGVARTLPKRTPESIARSKAWKPLTMPGGPLSDDLIRDRR